MKVNSIAVRGEGLRISAEKVYVPTLILLQGNGGSGKYLQKNVT